MGRLTTCISQRVQNDRDMKYLLICGIASGCGWRTPLAKCAPYESAICIWQSLQSQSLMLRSTLLRYRNNNKNKSHIVIVSRPCLSVCFILVFGPCILIYWRLNGNCRSPCPGPLDDLRGQDPPMIEHNLCVGLLGWVLQVGCVRWGVGGLVFSVFLV